MFLIDNETFNCCFEIAILITVLELKNIFKDFPVLILKRWPRTFPGVI